MTFLQLQNVREGAYLSATGSPRTKSLEEVMKLANRAAIAAVCAAFVMAPAASAARAHLLAGRSYCASGLYAQGVARYSKALQLLGKA